MTLISRAWYAFLRWVCERIGHDWSEWNYSETPEYGFQRHRHHYCFRCATSSGESGLRAFPIGVWVERYITEPTETPGHSRIVRIERRLTTESRP